MISNIKIFLASLFLAGSSFLKSNLGLLGDE